MCSKLRKAGTDLSRWREIDEFIIRNTFVLKNTIIETAEINHLHAEWICADKAVSDALVIYPQGGGFIMVSP